MTYRSEQIRKPIYVDKQLVELFNSLNKEYGLDALLSNKKSLQALSYDYIHGSIYLEGNSYTYGGLTTLIEKRITEVDTTIDEANMILNIKESLDFLFLVKAEPLTRNLIFEFHSILSSKLLAREHQGSIRKLPVTIGGSKHIPPLGTTYIESELDVILDIAKTINCPYSKSIYLQLNLSYLQAFTDINKRTARTVQVHTLLNNNLVPLFISKNSVEAQFINSVIKYYDEGDSTLFIEWFTKAYLSMYSKLLGRIITLDKPIIGRSNIFDK